VEYLVDHGADVNAKNENGETPLHYAASNGHLPIVQYLVQHGANMNIGTWKGETPLY
jgi:ankyrin repeat protein